MKFTKLRVLLAVGIAALLGLGGIAYSSIPLGGSIFPLTYITSNPGINAADAFNQMENLLNQQVVAQDGGAHGGGFTAFHGETITFGGNGASPTANPLMQVAYVDIPVSTGGNGINTSGTGAEFISAVSGRTIYPAGVFTIMASGTASGATSVKILCGTSGNVIATFPIAALVNNTPVTPFSSLGVAVATGVGMTTGCAAGQGVYASVVGSALATTTDVFINFPYVVQ